MKDPFLLKIVGCLAAGGVCSALSLSGYMGRMEGFALAGISISYPAPIRKIPLSFLGVGLTFLSWWLTQDREDWFQQQEKELERLAQLEEIEREAELEAYRYQVMMQQAEQTYTVMGAYLEQLPRSVPPVEMSVTPAQLPPAEVPANPTEYLNNFIEYPALIFGGQGAGKSWTVREIVARKVAAGHRVVILDPHAASREWRGVEVIGSGMDYAAISSFLDWYLAELVRRYQALNQIGSEEEWQALQRQKGGVVSVICEEMTNWADRVSNAGSFVKAAMSDSRKVLMPPLFVAHDRTLSCLGDVKGLSRLRDSSLLELELLADVHPVSRKPVASGKGKLKLPGHTVWMDVELPQLERKITDFSPYRGQPLQPVQQVVTPEPISDVRKQLEFLISISPDWQDEAFQKQFNPDEVPERFRPLVEYSLKHGWVKGADIQRNVRSYDGMSTAQIRQLFLEAEQQGIGMTKGEGDRLQFNADTSKL